MKLPSVTQLRRELFYLKSFIQRCKTLNDEDCGRLTCLSRSHWPDYLFTRPGEAEFHRSRSGTSRGIKYEPVMSRYTEDREVDRLILWVRVLLCRRPLAAPRYCTAKPVFPLLYAMVDTFPVEFYEFEEGSALIMASLSRGSDLFANIRSHRENVWLTCFSFLRCSRILYSTVFWYSMFYCFLFPGFVQFYLPLSSSILYPVTCYFPVLHCFPIFLY